MKKQFIIFLIFICLPLAGNALSGTSYNIGGTTHYNFSDGISGTSYKIGGTTHYNFSDGTSGTSYNIGGTRHYNFTEPVSGNSYDLGSGSNYSIHKYVPGEYYSTNGAILIRDYCKGLSYSEYPNWTTRGTELTTECMKTMCPKDGCNSVEFRNGLSKCTHQGPEEALSEILNICTKKKAAKYVDKVNIAISIISNTGSKNVIQEEKSLITKIDKNLSKRVSGNILLQVEKNGEGWYVFPDNQKKYYLGRPADAFSIMRNLGLGISHNELNNYLNSKFPSRLSGKIMLDVEQNGEAYYINPNDLKGYYLNRPSDAFRIMRELGLGITNDDVRKIDVGEVE